MLPFSDTILQVKLNSETYICLWKTRIIKILLKAPKSKIVLKEGCRKASELLSEVSYSVSKKSPRTSQTTTKEMLLKYYKMCIRNKDQRKSIFTVSGG